MQPNHKSTLLFCIVIFYGNVAFASARAAAGDEGLPDEADEGVDFETPYGEQPDGLLNPEEDFETPLPEDLGFDQHLSGFNKETVCVTEMNPISI